MMDMQGSIEMVDDIGTRYNAMLLSEYYGVSMLVGETYEYDMG